MAKADDDHKRAQNAKDKRTQRARDRQNGYGTYHRDRVRYEWFEKLDKLLARLRRQENEEAS